MTTTINFVLYYSRKCGHPFLKSTTIVTDDRFNVLHDHTETIISNCDYDMSQLWKAFRNLRNEPAHESHEFRQEFETFKTWSVIKVWQG